MSAMPVDEPRPHHAAETATRLPSLRDQAERLVMLGVPALAGVDDDEVRGWAGAGRGTGLLVVHPSAVPASALAPLLRRLGRPGFVVADMTDLDEFTPLPRLRIPDGPAYRLTGLDRGDQLANWSPEEALAAIVSTGRTPLTVSEGVSWLLQLPAMLERGHCFMTLGSRFRRPDGALDHRTPAIWISNGTGCDGVQRRHAPKIGWCWSGNRHTWLGFASADLRRGIRR